MLRSLRPLRPLAALTLAALACAGGGLLPIRSGLPVPERWHIEVTEFINTTVALEDDVLLYLGSSNEIGRDLFAHDASNGKLLWTVDLENYSTTDAPPASGGGLVFVAEYRTDAAGARAIFLGAFDVQTGERRWELPLGAPDDDPGGGTYPVVEGERVFFGSGFGGQHTLSAADLSGAPLWDYAFDGGLVTSPVVADGRILAVRTEFDDEDELALVFALDAATGQPLWEQTLNESARFTELAAGDGRLFINNFSGDICALDAATGETLWVTPLGPPPVTGSTTHAPTLAGDSLYVTGVKGDLTALDTATGDVRWSVYLTHFGKTAPSVGAGLLFVGDIEGYLRAFDTATGTEQWTIRNSLREEFMVSPYYPPMEDPHIVHGDVLYIVLDQNLVALDIEP